MHELRAIVEHWRRVEQRGGRAVLATIVRTAGSSYRRPGARMLLDDAGEATGFISGGCLEGDLHERAQQALSEERARTVVYDMTSPDDLVWGFGLGCNGIVHVLLQPLAPGAAGCIDPLACCALERTAVVQATLHAAAGWPDAPLGAHRALDPGGVPRGSLGDPLLDEAADPALGERCATGGTASIELELTDGRRCALLVERLEPPWPLVVFGAGPDAQPLVAGAKRLGAHVTVADHREAYASTDRFAEADRVVCAPIDRLVERITIDGAYVVLMTHHYEHDRTLLVTLLTADTAYLGLIGPRKRSEQLLDDLRDAGIEPEPAQLARLHAPVGLDIGADDPEAIALSILAELTAVRSRREGGFLRLRDAPLHDAEPTVR